MGSTQQLKSNVATQLSRQQQQQQQQPQQQQQQQQHYESFIPKPQPVGGAYHQNTNRCPTTAERLASARVAQQEARMRAIVALQYQTMMQIRMNQSVRNSNQ